MCPNRGLNLPRPGIEPETFWFTRQCSNRATPARANHFNAKQNYKMLRKNVGETIWESRAKQRVLTLETKSKNWLNRYQNSKLCFCKRQWKEKEKNDSPTESISKPPSIKGLVAEIYVKNSQNYNSKKKIQLENGQKTWKDVLPKKTHRWYIYTRQDSQHQEPPGNAH